LFRRASSGALYERLLEEKDKHLRILIAQIDYERAMRGQPSLPATILPGQIPDGVPATADDGDWISESEEAEAILLEQGLSPIHLPEILSGLGYGESDLA